jgi:hypothetical protein
MPDVVGNDPVAVWKAGDYLLVLVTDGKPLSARVVGDAATGLHYDAAIAVVDRRINTRGCTSRWKEASAASSSAASRKQACTKIAGLLTI